MFVSSVYFTVFISCAVSQMGNKTNIPLAGNRPVHELIDPVVETPQWLARDTFDINHKQSIRNLLRYPPFERRYSFTSTNQEPVIVSSEAQQVVASAAKVLQFHKAPHRLVDRRDYQPLLTTGFVARHKFAEGIHLRWRQIGSTDETLVTMLYMPTGWPLILVVTFTCCIVLVPLVGAFLLHVGFKLASFCTYFVWGPIKYFLRWIFIKGQLSNKHWQSYIAPPHFLEPHNKLNIPWFLRNDSLEDIPCELALKPPINKIDYTMYILTEEDYDEMDLGMDEMEFIDDLLQFRESNPKTVARLLKHRLGEEKFYYYFDEDILSDESGDEEEPLPPPEPTPKKPEMDDKEPVTEAEKSAPVVEYEYLNLLDVDEPWMHDEYDEKFTGPGYALEEIRKRRQIVLRLKDELRYLHNLITADSMFEKNYEQSQIEERDKALRKAKKIMDKFVRFSNITKQRIEEIEPSDKTQTLHNPALSKYLPLVDQMSHYNHRLNLKHEKQKDPARRKLQLDIFGGP